MRNRKTDNTAAKAIAARLLSNYPKPPGGICYILECTQDYGWKYIFHENQKAP